MWQQHCKTQGASIRIKYFKRGDHFWDCKTVGFNILHHPPVITLLFLTFFSLFLHYLICESSLEMCWDILTENRYHRICHDDWWTFPKRFANVHLSLACEWFMPICWEMTFRVFQCSEICPRMLISVSAACLGRFFTPKSSIDLLAGLT